MNRVYPPFGVPQNARIISGCNQAAATTAATPVAVLAAPVVATERYYITKAKYVNPTTNEIASAQIVTAVGAVVLATILAENLNTVVATPASQLPNGEMVFDPPIPVPVGEGVSVSPITTVGDSFLTLDGYIA